MARPANTRGRGPKMSRCRCCGNMYPLTTRHFYRQPKTIRGFAAACIKCHRARVQAAKAASNKKQRITAHDMPRQMFIPSYSRADPYYKSLRIHIHRFVTKHQLTVGHDQAVNWCALHACKAEKGTCNTCAGIAEAALNEWCWANRELRQPAVAAEQRAEAAEQTTKGWSKHHKGQGFMFIPSQTDQLFIQRLG